MRGPGGAALGSAPDMEIYLLGVAIVVLATGAAMVVRGSRGRARRTRLEFEERIASRLDAIRRAVPPPPRPGPGTGLPGGALVVPGPEGPLAASGASLRLVSRRGLPAEGTGAPHALTRRVLVRDTSAILVVVAVLALAGGSLLGQGPQGGVLGAISTPSPAAAPTPTESPTPSPTR